MYRYISRIVLLLIVSICLLFSTNNNSFAQEILVFETFEDGIDDGWTKAHESGIDLSGQWKILNGMYGLRIPERQTVENSLYGKETWSDYQISFDMLAVSGQDKNFIFRYQSSKGEADYNKWYELHISGTTINLKKIGYGNITPAKPFIVTNGQLINWKITAIGSNITIEYKKQTESTYQTVFNVSDSSDNPILSGKIGIRIGTGEAYPCEVYFDNIVVTNLSPITLLDVPFFSQQDPLWANTTYDSADTWASEGSQGIKNWGCALTSAAMILNYYDISKNASGLATTPETLNQYLNNNDGYSQKGHLNWPSIVEYAIKSIKSGQLSATARLFDFYYDDYLKFLIKNDIELERPGIIKIVTDPHSPDTVKDDDTHFVVSKGYDLEDNIYLADPIRLSDDNPKLEELYQGKRYTKMARFFPYVDFNYLWIYVHDDKNYAWIEALLDKLGEKDGVEYREIENADYSLEGVSGGIASSNLSPSWQFSIPKPQSDNYTLNLVSPTLSITPIEILAYDNNAEHKKIIKNVLVSPQFTRILDIEYDSRDSNNLDIKIRSTYTSVKESFNYAKQQGWISQIYSKHFLTLLEVSEKLSQKNNKSSQIILRVLNQQLNVAYRTNKLTKVGYDLLSGEVSSLINH